MSKLWWPDATCRWEWKRTTLEIFRWNRACVARSMMEAWPDRPAKSEEKSWLGSEQRMFVWIQSCQKIESHWWMKTNHHSWWSSIVGFLFAAIFHFVLLFSRESGNLEQRERRRCSWRKEGAYFYLIIVKTLYPNNHGYNLLNYHFRVAYIFPIWSPSKNKIILKHLT